MRIEKQTTPEAVITELGLRLARRRIELSMTQAQLAAHAGIGKRTIERIESGADTQLSTLIRLLSVLDLSEYLDQLIPEAQVSPMEMLMHQNKPRKRATSKKANKPKEQWKWGDE
ncbi:MAG: helix-turn-helix domain-containing protein [Phycisphaerales bacterium]|jgi:transcriptional regulator with XRE-family HTH domain|nr:helix-turn-helix domain-containing protein [Phycisphaerales bacterium]